MKIERNRSFTNHDLLDKEKRNLLMLDMIRKNGVISRSEIARMSGINAVSVSNYINNFIEKKLVLEKGFDISTGGRKPELVELNTGMNFVIGVDIGRAHLRGASADIALNIKTRKQAARPRDREVSAAVISLIEDIINSSNMKRSDIRAIGVGVHDARFIPVADAISKKTGIGAFVGPSAVCAAFAEKQMGQGADAGRLLYVYSDVGEGVVVNHDTYLSASEDAQILDGKLRYLRPWDDYLSIVENAKREVAKGIGTKIVSLANGAMESITREVVLAAAAADDEVALNIAQSAGINLGLRIAYLINLFAPEAVVIGGGIQAAGDIIFVPMKKMVERLAFRDNLKKLKIMASTLGEDAVDIGAASLAIREIFLKV